VPAERLQKVIAAAGVASRRGAEALIAAGRVTVDGRTATIGESVDPAVARVAVDGRPIGAGASTTTSHAYLAINKPLGVTSTVHDRHAERTVLDLVPPELRPATGRLFPVGRLDLDSEGLLLLTDDGAWADRVLHPRYGVEREYAVGVERTIDEEQVRELRRGMTLAEGAAGIVGLRAATRTETAALANVIDPRPDRGLTWYRVTLEQGRKRQIRRMLAAVGAPVRRLVRVRIGTLRLADLASGDVRPLRPDEVRRLGRGVAAAPRGAAGG
jgi:23S rRNA pseudouridine2605 synthase